MACHPKLAERCRRAKGGVRENAHLRGYAAMVGILRLSLLKARYAAENLRLHSRAKGGLPSVARSAKTGERRMVDQAGIEPATS